MQPRFSRSFLSFLTGDFNYVTLLEDLRSLDPELHKNLRFLQLYDGDAADLGLDFTITYERFGETVTQDLRYDGSKTDVTNQNKHAYVQAVARFHMVDRLKKPSEAFVGGLSDAVDVHLFKAFAAPELQVLISGADAPSTLMICASSLAMKTAVPMIRRSTLRAVFKKLSPARSTRRC